MHIDDFGDECRTVTPKKNANGVSRLNDA